MNANIASTVVDTSSGKFAKTPVYVASLYNGTPYWISVHAIYSPTPKGFTIQLMQSSGATLPVGDG